MTDDIWCYVLKHDQTGLVSILNLDTEIYIFV